jgi:hypothetical protein
MHKKATTIRPKVALVMEEIGEPTVSKSTLTEALGKRSAKKATPMQEALRAVETYKRKQDKLNRFIAEHGDIFADYNDLALEKNDARDHAKAMIKRLSFDKTTDIGVFRAIPKTRTVVNKALVPSDILARTAKTFDIKMLQGLVDPGVFEEAVTKQPSGVTQVNGPEETAYVLPD